MSLLNHKTRTLEQISISVKERYAKLLRTQPYIVQHSPLKHLASDLEITDIARSVAFEKN